MQRGEGELAAGDKNVPQALHLQEREVNCAGVLFIADSRRRWGEDEKGSYGKPERFADRLE